MSKKLQGNGLWESSRMFLPEHKEALLKQKRSQSEYSSPVLGEDQLQEIDRVIAESIEYDQAVTVTYAGQYETVQFWGWVKTVNRHEQRIKIINDEDALILDFEKILDVTIT
jgi:hypothetical protein